MNHPNAHNRKPITLTFESITQCADAFGVSRKLVRKLVTLHGTPNTAPTTAVPAVAQPVPQPVSTGLFTPPEVIEQVDEKDETADDRVVSVTKTVTYTGSPEVVAELLKNL